MSTADKKRATKTEGNIPWPKTAQEDTKPREDWRAYCNRRYQECSQHAAALEYLLQKYPEQRSWLAKHGFDVQELIRSLRWYPTEELEELDKLKQTPAKSAQQEKLRQRTAQNYDRIQENLLRLLPLVREVQEGIESTASSAASSKGSASSKSSKLYAGKYQSAYSSIAPVKPRWEF